MLLAFALSVGSIVRRWSIGFTRDWLSVVALRTPKECSPGRKAIPRGKSNLSVEDAAKSEQSKNGHEQAGALTSEEANDDNAVSARDKAAAARLFAQLLG